jgi:predicted nucleic acid-binding protein
MRAVHGLNDSEIDGYIQQIQVGAAVVSPLVGQTSTVVPHDPDDDPIVAAAIAGKVDVLCTRDRHLRRPDVESYCAKHGIRILTDVELLGELRKLAPPTVP